MQTALRKEPKGWVYDFKALDQHMIAGLRRAQIILGYATSGTDGSPLKSIAVSGGLGLAEVPTDLDDISAAEARDEFRMWAIGNGLSELDQTFYRYVEAATNTKTDLDNMQSKKKLTPHKPIMGNTYKIFSDFTDSLPATFTDAKKHSSRLHTLSNARNCLAHDSGIVTSKRINDHARNGMLIEWEGGGFFYDNGQERAPGKLVSQDEVGKRISFKKTPRTRLYNLGDRILLTPYDLTEIIVYYKYLAHSVSHALFTHYQRVIVTMPPPGNLGSTLPKE